MALARHSTGISRSGSSCIGESNVSALPLARPVSARLTQVNVYSAPSGEAE